MNDKKTEDYKKSLSYKRGLTFFIEKQGMEYIPVYMEGSFLEKFDINVSKWIGTPFLNILPKEMAEEVHKLCQMAEAESYVCYEGCYKGCYYLLTLSSVFESREKVIIHGTAIDITEQKQKEFCLQEKERQSLIERLAASVAHEIRNPLTSLQGFSQILFEETSRQEEAAYLDMILEEASRINQIVDKFLMVSVCNNDCSRSPMCLKQLLNSVVDYIQPELAKKKMVIRLTLRNNIMAVGNNAQLQIAFTHLMQNAIDSIHEAYSCIDVSLKKDGHYGCITISDQGSGISEDRIQRLFEPFYSTKEKGTGLGLMITKRIIDNHCGLLDVSSQEGEGTTVKVLLPCEDGI